MREPFDVEGQLRKSVVRLRVQFSGVTLDCCEECRGGVCGPCICGLVLPRLDAGSAAGDDSKFSCPGCGVDIEFDRT